MYAIRLSSRKSEYESKGNQLLEDIRTCKEKIKSHTKDKVVTYNILKWFNKGSIDPYTKNSLSCYNQQASYMYALPDLYLVKNIP